MRGREGVSDKPSPFHRRDNLRAIKALSLLSLSGVCIVCIVSIGPKEKRQANREGRGEISSTLSPSTSSLEFNIEIYGVYSILYSI